MAIEGACFCGAVKYEITGHINIFQYCHCSRCRKVTGSAHAANLFVSIDDFHWLSGEDHVTQYNPPETKYFAMAFCQTCGSNMPWLNKSGTTMIVPAGSLHDDPGIKPQQNIYCGSRPDWYISASDLIEYEAGPTRSK